MKNIDKTKRDQENITKNAKMFDRILVLRDQKAPFAIFIFETSDTDFIFDTVTRGAMRFRYTPYDVLLERFKIRR